jgi:acetyltransferase-like isoleucine patch superfamily enzyme
MDPTPGAATRRIAARLALACTLALGAALAGLPAAPVEAAAKRASPISWPTEGFQATRTGYNGREGAIGEHCHLENCMLGEGVTVGADNVLAAGARIFPGVRIPDGAIKF